MKEDIKDEDILVAQIELVDGDFIGVRLCNSPNGLDILYQVFRDNVWITKMAETADNKFLTGDSLKEYLDKL
jgi:hypothetical protein